MYRGIILFIMMIDRHRNGDRDARVISQAIGYAPFAVSKQFGRIHTFVAREKDIVAIYQGLVTLDASIKTGKLPAEAFWIGCKDLFYKHTR
jgi:butyrate kinase